MNRTSLIGNANYQSGFFMVGSHQINNQRTFFCKKQKKPNVLDGQSAFSSIPLFCAALSVTGDNSNLSLETRWKFPDEKFKLWKS
jgi:hypothetical protein